MLLLFSFFLDADWLSRPVSSNAPSAASMRSAVALLSLVAAAAAAANPNQVRAGAHPCPYTPLCL